MEQEILSRDTQHCIFLSKNQELFTVFASRLMVSKSQRSLCKVRDIIPSATTDNFSLGCRNLFRQFVMNRANIIEAISAQGVQQNHPNGDGFDSPLVQTHYVMVISLTSFVLATRQTHANGRGSSQ